MELINFELDAISSTEPLDEIVQQRCLVIRPWARCKSNITRSVKENKPNSPTSRSHRRRHYT